MFNCVFSYTLVKLFMLNGRSLGAAMVCLVRLKRCPNEA